MSEMFPALRSRDKTGAVSESKPLDPPTPSTTSRLDYFNCVVAIIGCVTGIIALGWHVWDSVEAREDKIVAHVGEQGGPGDGSWSTLNFYVDVTNIGQRPVYIKRAMLVWKDNEPGESAYDLKSSERPEDPIQPGGYRRYKVRPVLADEFEDVLKKSNDTMTVWITTSRGFFRLPADIAILKVILSTNRLLQKYQKAPANPK
jgi:hypothetical protein